MKKGIDVSYCQGNIDFDNLDKSKVEFAILRSSFGWEKGQKDSTFDRNVTGFRRLGIPIGAYHYSYATTVAEAKKEALYCLECIGGIHLDLPIFFDIEEDRIAKSGKRVCTDIVKAFCDTIKEHGYETGVYSNVSWLNDYLYRDELLGKYNLWLAQWGSSKPKYDCCIWQYDVGSSGSIRGISGEIDLDYMMYDMTSKKPATESNGDSQLNSSQPVSYDVVVTSNDGVNIRSGAGTSFQVKGAVPYGKKLHINRVTSGGGYTWGYTDYMGVKGWIALNFTRNYTYKVVVTSSNGVNIRKGASITTPIIGVVPNGVTLQVNNVIQRGHTWGHVSYNGVTGWIALDYTEKV